MTGRLLLGGAGVLVGAWGAVLLLRLGIGNLVPTLEWLAGGVVLHDAVVAPVVLLGATGLVGVRPPRWRKPLLVAFVVLGSVTLLGIPVLGRFGARPDNPTLLDRDYVAGWLALAGVVLVGAVVAALLGRAWKR